MQRFLAQTCLTLKILEIIECDGKSLAFFFEKKKKRLHCGLAGDGDVCHNRGDLRFAILVLSI